MTEEQPHEDPEFYAKYGFCRMACAEDDRLDRIELAEGKTQAQINADAVLMAMRALEAGETM